MNFSPTSNFGIWLRNQNKSIPLWGRIVCFCCFWLFLLSLIERHSITFVQGKIITYIIFITHYIHLVRYNNSTSLLHPAPSITAFEYDIMCYYNHGCQQNIFAILSSVSSPLNHSEFLRQAVCTIHFSRLHSKFIQLLSNSPQF